MLAYTYLEKGTFRLTDKPKPVFAGTWRRAGPGDAVQHLHQRPAHQARLRAPGGARYHRGP